MPSDSSTKDSKPTENVKPVLETKRGRLIKDESGHWVLLETPDTSRTEQEEEIDAHTNLSDKVIANVVAQSSIQLARAGVQTSRLDAELLLMHALGWDKEKLLRHWTHRINERQNSKFQTILERRLQREPLAYIIGYKWFHSLKFFVDDRVLIPRPETELLVDKAISIIRKEGLQGEQFAMADIGTGCGNIALSIANQISFIKIFAVDNSADAIAVAKINAALLSMEQTVAFITGDMLASLPHPVNLIVANLPYISSTDYDRLEPEITRYEPKSALISGNDGLDHYRQLFWQSPQYLLRGGKIICEVNPEQVETMRTIILEHLPTADIAIEPDLQGLSRLITVHTPL